MADLVKLLFTAKPGLYPPHKGGQTWLHEKATVRTVPHENAPDGVTMKVIPPRIVQSGETIEVDADTAETYTKRYTCFTVVGTSPSSGVGRRSRKAEPEPTSEA